MWVCLIQRGDDLLKSSAGLALRVEGQAFGNTQGLAVGVDVPAFLAAASRLALLLQCCHADVGV